MAVSRETLPPSPKEEGAPRKNFVKPCLSYPGPKDCPPKLLPQGEVKKREVFIPNRRSKVREGGVPNFLKVSLPGLPPRKGEDYLPFQPGRDWGTLFPEEVFLKNCVSQKPPNPLGGKRPRIKPRLGPGPNRGFWRGELAGESRKLLVWFKNRPRNWLGLIIFRPFGGFPDPPGSQL